jgi:hypothetical protein
MPYRPLFFILQIEQSKPIYDFIVYKKAFFIYLFAKNIRKIL